MLPGLARGTVSLSQRRGEMYVVVGRFGMFLTCGDLDLLS